MPNSRSSLARSLQYSSKASLRAVTEGRSTYLGSDMNFGRDVSQGYKGLISFSRSSAYTEVKSIAERLFEITNIL